MEASGYPDFAGHARDHREFIAHIREIQRAYDDGDEEVALEAAIDLRQNLAGHIDTADRRLAAVARGGH
jgi:hemerythrin